MNENQNEQMTKEQLDELEKRKLSGDHQFISLNREAAKELFTLARQGLQLREKLSQFELAADIVKREGETLRADLIQCNRENRALTAELEALRKDGERMSWLEQHNFRPEDSIALLSEVSVRTAIDSAMEKEKSV